MKQFTANVSIEDQWSVPPRCRGSNWGFVTTSDGIVMIDSPMVPKTALEWRDKIARKGEVRYLINTHHHVDHITGNFFFPGAVVSSQGVKELFDAPLNKVAGSERLEEALKIGQGTLGYIRLLVGEHDATSLPLMEKHHYQLKAPAITFTERLNLYVGGQTFELMHTPGHTEAHIGVYMPQAKVFFAGDNFTNTVQPSLAYCLPLEWVESRKKIEAMDIDVIVPGHDEVSDKKKIQEFRLFIQRCIDMVRDAIEKGMSKEQAADTISFEGFYPSVLTGPEAQRMNVLRLYEMLSK